MAATASKAATAIKGVRRGANAAARAGHAIVTRDQRALRQASRRPPPRDAPLVQWLSDVGRSEIASVGGKKASLGEMINQLRDAGFRVPGGFATTAAAYWQLIEANDLAGRLAGELCAVSRRPRYRFDIGKSRQLFRGQTRGCGGGGAPAVSAWLLNASLSLA